MPTSNSFAADDGVRIAFYDWRDDGESAPPVVLHHGFVANASANWELLAWSRRWWTRAGA